MIPDDLPDLDGMFPSSTDDFLHDVKYCPRCTGTHPNLLFKSFNELAEHTHWGMCPTTREPILVDMVIS